MEILDSINKQLDNELLKDIGFALFAMITFLGASYLLFTKNVLYAAYGLLVTFLGIAGLYVFAGADFVAVTQIMVYVGGILVLMIFGIMLTQNKQQDAETSNAIGVSHLNITFGIVVSIALFIGLATMLFYAKFTLSGNSLHSDSTIRQLGVHMMTDQFLVFEVVGILLLVALIGAAFVAKKVGNES